MQGSSGFFRSKSSITQAALDFAIGGNKSMSAGADAPCLACRAVTPDLPDHQAGLAHPTEVIASDPHLVPVSLLAPPWLRQSL